MSNPNRPYGFAPIRGIGSPWDGQANLYYIPSTDQSAYYIGDPVVTETGADANGVPLIEKAAGNATTLRGVIVAIMFDPTNLSMTSIPATTKGHDYYVLVCDDPNALFSCRFDNGTPGNIVAAMIGNNAEFIVTAPSPSTMPISASTLDSGNIADTSTFPFKIMGLRRTPGNGFGSFSEVIVKINTHELQSVGTAGA